MKTIGLIGGMSWESSAIYYDLINKEVKQILGGFNSAKCILNSVNFAEIEFLQRQGDWNKLNQKMIEAAQQLENAGADLLILGTNTMHLCSEEIIKNTSIPFLHIATATGKNIKSKKLDQVALLGTKFTMEKDFYKKILQEDFGIKVIIPNETDRNRIHRIIYDELVLGEIREESKLVMKQIIKDLQHKGVQGTILGCTELPLLITENDVDIPVFNTTEIHAKSAVEMALKEVIIDS
ncbi:aspartate/glutamate racemase family protein [Aquimarina sp. D1M17]|uniref:aspartate/glutamate racemase family protein n=1 Tax=Aquimarina acroporae TaxID=2937283 RepID=UPI0020C0B2DD|nr:aspartate/glutamate racemase family protein [Aquimarina acroporae]MCK8520253.1 aspartate/glutamate racemase family protein [Aquimarina acroporae]